MNADHVYITAEAGVNHNGQRDLAFALVDAAAPVDVVGKEGIAGVNVVTVVAQDRQHAFLC